MIYEYKCDEHGLFEEVRNSDERDNPAYCPECGRISERRTCPSRVNICIPEGFRQDQHRVLPQHDKQKETWAKYAVHNPEP